MPRLTTAAAIAALPSHDYRRRLPTDAQVRAAVPPPLVLHEAGLPDEYLDGMPLGTCYCQGCLDRRWAAAAAFAYGWLRSGTAIALDERRQYPCATGLRN